VREVCSKPQEEEVGVGGGPGPQEEEEEVPAAPLALPTKEEIDAAEQEEFAEEEEDSDLVPEGELKMVCLVRKDLNMSKGKIAAQAGHAFLGVFRIAQRLALPSEWIKAWSARGCAKITLKVENEEELDAVASAARAAGLPTLIIEDAGRTEVAAGTRTVCAIGPAPVALVNTITGKGGKFPLQLLA
jgi:PTH2 family peptidyl-tRNA hydrolase